MRLIKQYPIWAFYILAFAISWLGWVPQTLHNRGLFPFDHPLLSFLGGAGPTLAAVIVVWALKGKDGPLDLFAPLFQWRAGWQWFAFVFLAWFVIAAAALGAGALFGQGFPSLALFAWPALLPIFITMLLSNVWEEIGWRGFALPRFQEQYGDLKIAILMGILWELWHLPLILDPTNPMSSLPWYGGLLFSLALSVIYIWLYNHTQRSLLFVSIFHAMSNTVAFALLELDVFTASYLWVVGVTSIFAILIVLRYGMHRFGKSNIQV